MADKDTLRHKIGFWEMVQNIIIESISKGVFFGACLFILALTALIKMPNEDVSNLVFKILAGFAKYYYWGYITTMLVVIGWYLNVKWVKDSNVTEMNRLVEERNELQEKILGTNITSSES